MVTRVSRTSAIREQVKQGKPVAAVQPRTTNEMDVSGRTVTIACNAPSGLILRTHIQVKNPQPQGPHGREPDMMSIPDPDQKPIRVRGPNVGRGADAGMIRHTIAGGYGLTRNVPKDFWLKWLEENKNSPLVKNKVIFACDTAQAAEEEAVKLNTKSGFEPMDPEAAPKEMRTGRKHLKMEQDDGL